MDSNLNDFEENIKNLYLSIKESEIIKFIEKEFKDAVELQIDAILNYDKYRKQKEVKQHLAEMEKDFYGKIV